MVVGTRKVGRDCTSRTHIDPDPDEFDRPECPLPLEVVAPGPGWEVCHRQVSDVQWAHPHPEARLVVTGTIMMRMVKLTTSLTLDRFLSIRTLHLPKHASLTACWSF